MVQRKRKRRAPCSSNTHHALAPAQPCGRSVASSMGEEQTGQVSLRSSHCEQHGEEERGVR